MLVFGLVLATGCSSEGESYVPAAQYEIYFPNDLAEAGWGVPVAKDLGYLMSIEFGYQSSDNGEVGTFAFQIDDVTFY